MISFFRCRRASNVVLLSFLAVCCVTASTEFAGKNIYTDYSDEELVALYHSLLDDRTRGKVLDGINRTEFVRERRRVEIRLASLFSTGVFLDDDMSISYFEKKIRDQNDDMSLILLLSVPAENDGVYKALIRCYESSKNKAGFLDRLDYASRRRQSKMADRCLGSIRK